MGMIARKTIVVPCIVNSSLNRCAPTRVLSGAASCSRMIRASMPPTRKKMNALVPYRMPIRLWSTVVIQDQRPLGAAAASPGMNAACVAMGLLYLRLRR